MTQYAIIKRLLANEQAEAEVLRGTACGGECGSCETCHYASKIRVKVENAVGAQPGDRVEIETRTSRVLGAAAMVYVLPFVLFFIGYAIAAAMGLNEGGSMLMSFAFFALGLGIVVVYGRFFKKKPITYEVTEIIAHGAEEV